jgi:hypothetical protein
VKCEEIAGHPEQKLSGEPMAERYQAKLKVKLSL